MLAGRSFFVHSYSECNAAQTHNQQTACPHFEIAIEHLSQCNNA
jgi:hypothetical protein